MEWWRVEDEDEETVLSTAKNNTENLMEALFRQHSSIADFLTDDDLHLALTSAPLTPVEESVIIEKSYDIDGCVVELAGTSAVKGSIHTLLLQPNSLANYYPMLKKHVVLSDYTNEGLQSLKHVHGSALAYSGAWKISVCLFPAGRGSCVPLTTSANAQRAVKLYISRVADAFSRQLQRLSGTPDMKRPSIKKNRLHDVHSMHVLPQDQSFLLSLLDGAMEEVESPEGTSPFVLATKFGQKQKEPEDLSAMFDLSGLRSVSVHTAVTFSAESFNTHLLWARGGLQQVVGRRGRLFPCMSFTECANFQSNLDNRPLDISAELRGIAKFPTNLTFIQLYADIAHSRPRPLHAHPVSGSIATCGLLHKNATRALSLRASTYLGTMQDNITKLDGIFDCRLEIVNRLEDDAIPTILCPTEFFEEEKLSALESDHPMFVPLYELDDQFTFRRCVKGMAEYLLEDLISLHRAHRHIGGYMASWRSYQLELALEVFFFGEPFLASDATLCTNLGVSGSSYRSTTVERGVLGLAPCNAAANGDSPPPVRCWTSSEETVRRITRLFDFSDVLSAADCVLGRKLVEVLLYDLYDGRYFALHTLCQQDPPAGGRCIGSITLDQLSVELCKKDRFSYPFTFGRACELVLSSGKPIGNAIKAGMIELELVYFPALRATDSTTGRTSARWNHKDFWNVVSPNLPATACALAANTTADVMVNLVSLSLTYSRNMEVFKDSVMPWISPVLRRLTESGLSRDQQVTVCSFVTCIALLQQGVYIDYYRLSDLERELPLSQRHLQRLEILSNQVLAGFNRPKLWKLHSRIPFNAQKASVQTKSCAKKRKHEDEHAPEPMTELEAPEVLDDVVEQSVIRLPLSRLPARWNRPWSSMELAYVAEAVASGGKTRAAMYEMYCNLCRNNSVPARTIESFKKKAIECRH